MRFLKDHVAGVEAGRHLDDRHAGLRLAVEDGVGDRGRAAVLRQQRGVDVDRAARRHREHVLREDLPVGRDDEQIGPQLAELRQPFGRVDALGLDDRHAAAAAMFAMPLPVWRVLPRLLPASRSGCVTRPTTSPAERREQRLERRLGERPGAHHHDSHAQIQARPSSGCVHHRLRLVRLSAYSFGSRSGGRSPFFLAFSKSAMNFSRSFWLPVQAERAHLVDEQHAVEVVDLVLPDAGRQVAARHLVQLALEVVRLHLHRLRPAHVLVQPGEAQAPLAVVHRALALDDHRVDGDVLHVLLSGSPSKFITSSWMSSPTCGAARPSPRACTSGRASAAAASCTSLSMAVTGRAAMRRAGCGYFTIFIAGRTARRGGEFGIVDYSRTGTGTGAAWARKTVDERVARRGLHGRTPPTEARHERRRLALATPRCSSGLTARSPRAPTRRRSSPTSRASRSPPTPSGS